MQLCNKPNIREKVTLTKVPYKIFCELPYTIWGTAYMQSSTQVLPAQMGNERSLGTSSTNTVLKIRWGTQPSMLLLPGGGNMHSICQRGNRRQRKQSLCLQKQSAHPAKTQSRHTTGKFLPWWKIKLELSSAPGEKKKSEHTNTHTHQHYIIPTCTLSLSFIYNIHNIYMIPLQVVVALHAWWHCFFRW